MELSVVPSLSLSPRRALPPLPARRAARRPAFACRCSCSADAASAVATRRWFASLLAAAAGSWLLCSLVVWVLFAGGTARSDRFFALFGVAAGVGVAGGRGEAGAVSTSRRAVST